jgi:hypothetical protein
VDIFNKRNAIVGFITLKAMSRWREEKRNRRKRRGARIAAFVTLGIVSVGIVAAIAAVLHRRSGDEVENKMHGFAIGEDADSEIVGEYVATPESLPAT